MSSVAAIKHIRNVMEYNVFGICCQLPTEIGKIKSKKTRRVRGCSCHRQNFSIRNWMERKSYPISFQQVIASLVIGITSSLHCHHLVLFCFHVFWASQTCWSRENKPSERISKFRGKVTLFTAAGTATEFQIFSTAVLWAGSFQKEKPLGLGFVSNLPHLSSLLYESLSRRTLF